MDPDLTNLSDEDALAVGTKLLTQLEDARAVVESAQRREAGLRKIIHGLVEMFPAVEDLLPEDFDGEDAGVRPRGAEAVRRVLDDQNDKWFSVDKALRELQARRWEPDSSNPANAVRSALERLVEAGTAEKTRSTEGVVIYKIAPGFDFDEEPF